MPTVERLRDRFKSAWNAFREPVKDIPSIYQSGVITSSYNRPDRVLLNVNNERTTIASIYNRLAMDVAQINIMHCRIDANGNYKETINSKLNKCLTIRANIDQSAAAFVQDAVLIMLDEGSVALVPIDTSTSIRNSESFDIWSIRAGRIVEWYPRDVRVRLYNDRTGQQEDIVLPKETIAIAENPFYSVMNEPNSTYKRLVNKLNLLDVVDRQQGSGKLDLIIQLPYVIKGEAKREQAEKRKKDIEDQLANSKFGIAYTDGTEKITQLNRSVENNLMEQVQYLTELMFSQLGLTQAILDGTASEQEMTNYYNRTVSQLLKALTDAMKWAFLTDTARSQGQSILGIRNPFNLVPASEIANIADKFTRNEILSSNEVRTIIGYRPVDDERANELRNKNLKTSDSGGAGDDAPSTDLDA